MKTATKSNKWIGFMVVMGILASYFGILFFIDSFSNKLGLAQWLNGQRILVEHKKDLLKRIQKDTHFKNIDLNAFISETQRLVKMKGKRNLSSWISFRTFTPNIYGEYIRTNDFGMRSDLNLKEMIKKAQSNKKSGIKNILLLGGSAAFGYGSTESKKTISGYLNSILVKDGYEVFNLAQGGYTSYMELFIFSTIGIYFEPDVVLVMDGYADSYSLAYSSEQDELPMGIWSEMGILKNPTFIFNSYYQNLEAICKLSNIPNNKVVLAVQPISGFENNSLLDENKIENFWEFYPMVRATVKLAAKMNNANFVDLSILFNNESNSRINFFDKSHLSATGQRKVAEALTPHIVSPMAREHDTHFISMAEREMLVDKILKKDYSGTYKVARDY